MPRIHSQESGLMFPKTTTDWKNHAAGKTQEGHLLGKLPQHPGTASSKTPWLELHPSLPASRPLVPWTPVPSSCPAILVSSPARRGARRGRLRAQTHAGPPRWKVSRAVFKREAPPGTTDPRPPLLSSWCPC